MSATEDVLGKGMVEGLIGALSDKHAQLDLRLKGVTLNLVGAPVKLEVNGTVSVSVHMRDLTKEETAALAAAHIAATKAA